MKPFLESVFVGLLIMCCHSVIVAQESTVVHGSSHIHRSRSVDWKPLFTLDPSEGTTFTVDTAAIASNAGVPVLSIASDGSILLGVSGGPGVHGIYSVLDNGNRYQRLPGIAARGPDGGCIYLPDGRTRFVGEEPAPGSAPQRRRSHIASWISLDGYAWTKEPGIRYQPGAEDDSISSVPSVLQVHDSVWRMYYVGDFYRTNGARTAISTDWGRTWTRESNGNILAKGDVDPQPVHLSDGRVRLYFRTGFGPPSPNPLPRSGVAYNDSPDGLDFDTSRTMLVISDTAGVPMLKLDPSVIRFPNGDIACYIGAAPMQGSPLQPKVIAAWARKTASESEESSVIPSAISISIAPQPVLSRATVRVRLPHPDRVRIRVCDALGRVVATIVDDGRAFSSDNFPIAIERPGVFYLIVETSDTFSATPFVAVR